MATRIGPDYYNDAPLPGMDTDADAQINAFVWSDAFPGIFAAGEFDAVIGNPPYLSVDDTWGRRDPRSATHGAIGDDVLSTRGHHDRRSDRESLVEDLYNINEDDRAIVLRVLEPLSAALTDALEASLLRANA